MHLRPMIRTDLPAVVDIALDAFYNDHFHQWLFPGYQEAQMKNARRRQYFGMNKKRFISNSVTGIVCVQPSDKTPNEERILGYAWWERIGPSDSKTQKAYTSEAQGIEFAIERSLMLFQSWYERWIDRNPLSRPDRFAAFLADVSNWNNRLAAYWYCEVLAVRPEEEGKGVGSMLLKWGLDKADQESIPATIEASIAGSHMYRKRGFRTVDWGYIESFVDQYLVRHPGNVTKGDILPVRSLGGNDYMVYDPKRLYTRDINPHEQDWVEHGGFMGRVEVKWTV